MSTCPCSTWKPQIDYHLIDRELTIRLSLKRMRMVRKRKRLGVHFITCYVKSCCYFERPSRNTWTRTSSELVARQPRPLSCLQGNLVEVYDSVWITVR